MPPADRRWWLEFHRTGGRPASVGLGSVALTEFLSEIELAAAPSGWAFLPGDRVVVKVPDSASAISVRLTR